MTNGYIGGTQYQCPGCGYLMTDIEWNLTLLKSCPRCRQHTIDKFSVMPKEQRRMKVTDEMVGRFLTWQLPKTFTPDCGISFKPLNEWPVGTNLFTATEARQMLEHVLLNSVSELDQIREQWRDSVKPIVERAERAAVRARNIDEASSILETYETFEALLESDPHE